MHSNLSISNRGAFSTLGSSIVAMASFLAVPSASAAPQYIDLQNPVFTEYATSDTWQSSVVKPGPVSMLLSDAAKRVIGEAGLMRLRDFIQLQAGWDGRASRPLNLSSVTAFSAFFDKTRFFPAKMGIFMSAQGNVVVNWPDAAGKLVELEFNSLRVDYFIESSGVEESVAMGASGFNQILDEIKRHEAA